jgi:ribulose-phosphate 3-epimerase
MIVDPDRYISRFQAIGIQYLSVHYEACAHLHRTLQYIRNSNMKAGVALNPHTPVALLEDILEEADFVLIMSVNPGFAAQKFIPQTIHKIIRLKEMICKKHLNCLIEVDGGVNLSNAKALVDAGADILVAGNAIFNAPSPAAAIASLKSTIHIESL